MPGREKKTFFKILKKIIPFVVLCFGRSSVSAIVLISIVASV